MIRTFKVFRGVPATWLLVSCASLLSPVCGAQPAQPRPSVSDLLAQAFVTVDGQPQSRALAEVLLRELAARGTPATPQTLAEVRDALVDQALMVREAARAGLDSNPLMQAQIEILRQRALANAWQQSVLQAVQPSEDELKAEYERQVAVLGARELRLRQLLVREEPTARLLHDRIRGGDKMAALAPDYSIDPDTRAEGGLGGWLPEGGLAAPIAQAVKGVGPGQLVPAPVRTSSGWHVLQVEEVRPYVAPPLSQVRPQVRQAIAQRVLQQRLEALRRAAKVD
jgi:peptidyl-prolyl cis-trans isomerase C